MNNQDSKNLQDKRVLLGLLLEAHKAGRNVERLEGQIKYWKMKYPLKTGFRIDEFDGNMKEYIKSLENEVKEEKEFLDYVVRNYCTDQGKCSPASELSENPSRWN